VSVEQETVLLLTLTGQIITFRSSSNCAAQIEAQCYDLALASVARGRFLVATNYQRDELGLVNCLAVRMCGLCPDISVAENEPIQNNTTDD